MGDMIYKDDEIGNLRLNGTTSIVLIVIAGCQVESIRMG
jgi:hypothetical protein